MSDDLIKRSDAIKAVWGDDINPSEDGMVFEAQSHIDRDIRLIPSADRPQGEWVSDYSSPVAYRCTACNTLQHWSVIQNGRYRFCPNCGAKMKGADDEV